MHIKTIFIACAFFLSLSGLTGQSFSGHPPGLHWQKLKTSQGNIFYPKSIESKALQAARTVQHFYDTDYTLGNKRFKINMVLQNQTINSNGYVSIGPFLSEFYLTPPHDPYVLGSLDWTQALSTHEYRHVIQAMNSRVGINNFIYHLLGEEAWGASYGLTVPNWFDEGDAVNSETIHSDAGRGRMPSFVTKFRALNQSQVSLNYNKARNGSYKDLIPNHYVFGYTMVQYVNEHFGRGQWNNIFKEAVKYKGLFFSFNKALKKHTGLSVSQLYDVSIGTLKAESNDRELSDSIVLKNNQEHVIKNFISPQLLKDGSMIYLESASDHLPRLYHQFTDGNRKKLTSLGISTDEDFTFKEPLICWTEITKDLRWDNKDYSDIFYFNLKNNSIHQVTHHQKYFRPSISNDLTKIICMEYTPEGTAHLVLLNTAGKILQKIETDQGWLPTYPIFENGDTSILTILRGNSHSSIRRYFLNGHSYKTLLTPERTLMSNLSSSGDTLYFSSDLSGRDNIYALNKKTMKLFQITDNSVGIQRFYFKGDTFWYNYQTARGIEIRKKKKSDLIYKPVSLLTGIPTLIVAPEARTSILEDSFITTSANLLNNPFRVYSWSVRPDEGGNTFRISGRNVLNTLTGTAAYSYQLDEKSHTISNSISIGSWYPVFTSTIAHTFNRHITKPNNSSVDSIRWNETGYRLSASVPWQYYYHNQIIRFQPVISFGLYKPDYVLSERKNYASTQFIRSGFSIASQNRQALQHVSNRFTQNILVQWNQSINNGANGADLITSFHFPGILNNHVIELNFDIHSQELADPYRFPNPTNFISGYTTFSSDRSTWARLAYHFTLLYPDLGIPGIFFLKRVRTRVFGERMTNLLIRKPSDLSIKYHTIGSELIFDLNAVNTLPVSFGVRYSHLLNTDLLSRNKKQSLEFIVERLF
ncbi:MAG: hypothetical protein ABIR66_10985 [Saprospiraceae bacterium]